jgi:hypothetical protein
MVKFIQSLGGILLAGLSAILALLFFTPLGGEGFTQRLREHYQHALQAGRDASAAKRQELETELQKMNEGKAE